MLENNLHGGALLGDVLHSKEEKWLIWHTQTILCKSCRFAALYKITYNFKIKLTTVEIFSVK